MKNQSFEFKYSVRKLLIRIIIGIPIAILGFTALFLYLNFRTKYLYSQGIYYNYQNFDIWEFITVGFAIIGLTMISHAFWRMIFNKRVFLQLDMIALRYKDVELPYKLIFIPRNSKSCILWNNIKNIRLKHGIFIRNEIEITLQTMKKGRNTKKSISIVCSQDSVENIMDSIYLFWQQKTI